MTEWPPVYVQIMTFQRPQEIRINLNALAVYLNYPNLHYVICDDSSGGDYLLKLEEDFSDRDNITFLSTPERGGFGKNANNGLNYIYAHKGEFIFFLEDDRILTTYLDLKPGVALMAVHQGMGYLRYGGILGHKIVGHLFEADVSLLIQDFRQGRSPSTKLGFWQFDGKSPELWMYSNQPHLKHIRFHQFYGLYPEGLKLGATEVGMAHTVKDKMGELGAPGLGVLPEWVINQWDDIGKSRQWSDDDIGEIR